MKFLVERITSIDLEAFNACFEVCKAEVIGNMPWDRADRALYTKGVTEDAARTWVLARYQEYAARNDDVEGFCFQIKDADSGRVLAIYTAKVDDGALALHLVMFNNDETGHRRAWLREYFSSTTLQDFVVSVGCTKWYQDIFTDGLIDAVGGDFANDGKLGEGKRRTRIYSSYGWN